MYPFIVNFCCAFADSQKNSEQKAMKKYLAIYRFPFKKAVFKNPAVPINKAGAEKLT
jgi:hypothetical protein